MGSLEQIKRYWHLNLDDLQQQNPRGVLIVDLDGTITIDEPSLSYSEKKPNIPVIAKLHE